MKKCTLAFTLSEMLIVMAILGIIAILLLAAIKVYNPTSKGNINKGKRVLEEIDQAITLILAERTPDATLTYIKDSKGAFSIEDSDATGRLAEVFKNYVNFIDNAEKINYKYKNKSAESYYSSNIINYNKQSTGKVLKDLYSNFMIAADGTIWGFRTYNSCSSTEELADPPGIQGKFSVPNICASVFYDVNAYKGPNKLGYDQFIIPINTTGTYYNK